MQRCLPRRASPCGFGRGLIYRKTCWTPQLGESRPQIGQAPRARSRSFSRISTSASQTAQSPRLTCGLCACQTSYLQYAGFHPLCTPSVHSQHSSHETDITICGEYAGEPAVSHGAQCQLETPSPLTRSLLNFSRPGHVTARIKRLHAATLLLTLPILTRPYGRFVVSRFMQSELQGLRVYARFCLER